MSTFATSPNPPLQGALYRAVWRWHFFAGVLVAPFALWLAVTGAIYLWKPQYEAWRYRDLVTVAVPANGQTRPVEEQFAAAMAQHPAAQPVTFTPAFSPDAASELVVRVVQPGSPPDLPVWAGERTSIYVNPYTGAVTGEVVEKERLMQTVMLLHGELLAGNKGSFFIELAASWMFVLLLTGVYLWWPRPQFSVWGFLLPRLRAKDRTFWRDLHAVPAVWASAAALFLLATGIPWTQFGGSWFRTISAATGEGSPRESEAGAHRSELTGWSPPLKAGLAPQIDRLASKPDAPAGHAHHDGMTVAESLPAGVTAPPRITLDRAMAIAAEHRVPRPYALALPVGPTGVLSALSDRNQAFTRAYLHLDQYSGRVLADVRYDDFGLMGKFFLWGIIAHEGQLFGLLNQILGTLACAGVFVIAASGLALWWQRRPAGKIAAPQSTASLPRAVFLGTLAMALLLPLLAGSLVALLLFDRLLSSRLPWFQPAST